MTIKKVFAIFLALIMALSLAACKSRSDGEPSEKRKGARENVTVSENPRTDENSSDTSRQESSEESSSEPEKDPVPEELANSLLSALKSGNRENIQAFGDYNTLFNLTGEQNADWLLRQVLMRLEYEVLFSEVEESKAVVTAKLSNLDMNQVLPLYFEQAMAISFENASEGLGKTKEELDEEYRQVFTDLLATYENTRRDKITEIELEKKDDEWKVISTSALGDAALGGFLEAQDRVRGDMQPSRPEQDSYQDSYQDDDEEYSDIRVDEGH